MLPSNETPRMPALGAVAIGRNEGERLLRCLESLRRAGLATVYVDSGSQDGSRETARARGACVVELDLGTPFTAARARNAGFAQLVALRPDLELVQFVDGDCELEDGWIASALAALRKNPAAAVVCGRRKERYPEASVYNLLCDLEWDTPIGDAEACGGDALYRRAAFAAVGGFREDLIAGEEPELCHRLRAAGGWVLRIDAPMTRHDAAMTAFGQWWRRTVRSGHAAAELWSLHGRRGVRGLARIAESALFWAILAPLAALAVGVFAAAAFGPVGLAVAPLLLALALLRLALRVRAHRRARGAAPRAALLFGIACAIGKWPEAQGVLRYAAGRLFGRRSALIEYKGASAPAARGARAP